MPMQPGYAPRPMITADGQQWVPAPAAPGQPQPMYTGQSPMPLHTNMPQYHSRQNMTGGLSVMRNVSSFCLGNSDIISNEVTNSLLGVF